jgi:2-keto-4-pentenoate hydratase/2-oxohepta-3-ene-1,7-dioic acid hydratase in catechol pathway
MLRSPVAYARAPHTTGDRHMAHAPAVRELLRTPQASLTRPADWTVDAARHFWTVFGNDAQAEAREGLQRRPYPRFLGAPASALAASGHRIVLPARARTLTVTCELACVIKRVASQLSVDEARDAILGYLPLAALRDSSFADQVVEPASAQEQHLPAVYARWPDGFNVTGTPQMLTGDQWRGRRCTAHVDGFGTVETHTGDYLFAAAEIIAYISRYITLFPGDVLALGTLGAAVTLPAGQPIPPGTTGYVEIEGLGRADFALSARPGQD